MEDGSPGRVRCLSSFIYKCLYYLCVVCENVVERSMPTDSTQVRRGVFYLGFLLFVESFFPDLVLFSSDVPPLLA